MDEVYTILYDPKSPKKLYQFALMYVFNMNSPVNKHREKNNKCMVVTKIDVLIRKYGGLLVENIGLMLKIFILYMNFLKITLKISFMSVKE